MEDLRLFQPPGVRVRVLPRSRSPGFDLEGQLLAGSDSQEDRPDRTLRRSKIKGDRPLRGQEKVLERLPIRERHDIGQVTEALYVVFSVHVAAVVQNRDALLQACGHIKVVPSPEDLVGGNMGLRGVA